MKSEKMIFNLTQEEFERRKSFDIPGCGSNCPITDEPINDEPALEAVLRGSKKLLKENAGLLYRIYRSPEKRGRNCG